MNLFRRPDKAAKSPVGLALTSRYAARTVPVLLEPSGREAVTVDADYCARWDLHCVEEPLATRRFPRGIARIRGDGRLLVSIDDWDTATTVQIRRWDDFSDVGHVPVSPDAAGAGAVDLSPDGTRIAAAAWGGPLVMINVADLSVSNMTNTAADSIGELRWSPHGDMVAALAGDDYHASLRLYRIAADDTVSSHVELETGLEGYQAEVGGTLCFSSDGARIYASVPYGESSTLLCHEVASGALVWSRLLDLSLAGSSANIDEFRSTMAISYGDRLLLHGNNGGEVLMFDATSGRLTARQPLRGATALSWLAASPTEPVFWATVDAIPQQYPC